MSDQPPGWHSPSLLAEVDRRRLYLGLGYSSLFAYCTQVLRLSEPAAYSRITAARLAGKFPGILTRLGAGDVTLTAVTLLAAHLTEDNHETLLDAARHKSKREVEHLVARLDPQPDVSSTIRKLPAPVTTVRNVAPSPLLTNDGEVARATGTTSGTSLLAPPRTRSSPAIRHWSSNGRWPFCAKRSNAPGRARRDGRACGHNRRRVRRVTYPAVRRSVWSRDRGQCAFVGTDGRCNATAFLEIWQGDAAPAAEFSAP